MLGKDKEFYTTDLLTKHVVKHSKQSYYKFLDEITVNYYYLFQVTFVEVSFSTKFYGVRQTGER